MFWNQNFVHHLTFLLRREKAYLTMILNTEGTSMIHKNLLFTFMAINLLINSANANNKKTFNGTFGEILTQKNEACQKVFTVTDYNTKHYIMGPTDMTSVLNFTNANSQGFFHSVTFVGNYYNGETYYEGRLTKDDLAYKFKAEGLVGNDFVVFAIELEALNADGSVLCRASAKYFGDLR